MLKLRYTQKIIILIPQSNYNKKRKTAYAKLPQWDGTQQAHPA